MLTWARQHSDDGDTLNIEGVTVNPENLTTYIWKNLFSKFRKCQRIWSPPITGEIRVKFKFSFFFNIGLMCSTKWIEQELSTCWRGSRYFTLSKQILAFSIIYPLISHPCWWSNLTVLVCVFARRCSYTLSEMYSVRWQNTRQRWSLWSKNYKWIMPGQGLSLGVRAMHFFDNRLLS